jgi:AcrR family transcriptional regulator
MAIRQGAVVRPGRARLPRPRKTPTQARSRALVEAVVEAARRILDSEGAAALTIQRIADVSGATVGSIYQYFPGKDAIVALVCERELEAAVEHLHASIERLRRLPLAEALREILANTIRVERRLSQLDREFHLRHYADLQLGMRCGDFASPDEYVNTAWMAFLALYGDEVTTRDRHAVAYVLGMGMRAVIRAALEDDPARLDQPALLDVLVDMALGAIRPQTSPAVVTKEDSASR